ncbi:MAG: extracellular solute-binding protein, partial [Clostridiales bacterium]|nr:extracellular solute-binding protein [Clostridiales bacterium]
EENTPNLIKLFEENALYAAHATSPDGSIYGLPHAEFDINNYVVMWNIIREDWLKKLNLDMPTTIDELHDLLVAFRDEDPNGNDEKDEVPLGYQNESMFGLYTLKHAFGFEYTDLWSVNQEGKVAFDLVDEKFLECLTTLNQWYNEGLLNTTIDGSDSDTLIAQDRLGAQTVSSMDNVIGKNDSVHPVNPEGNYVFIPMLGNEKYPDNDPKLNKRQDFHDYYAVTVDCKNPELAVKWLDWVYASEESSVLRYWGFENDTYEIVDGEMRFTYKVAKADTSAIDVMRSIGGWPNFAGNENGASFMAMYLDTYCEQAYNDFKDIMIPRVPILIGTEEESRTYSQKWPEIDTFVRESVVNFINGNKPLSQWEEYVSTIDAMGLQEVLVIRQNWYDRMVDIMK